MSVFVRWQQLRRVAAAVAAVALVGLAAAAPAGAHAFLIRSDPAAGARLAEGPATLTLYFSEPFVRRSEHVTLRRVGGESVKLSPPASSAAIVHQPLPANLRGVYVVSWRVLTDEGHISLGQFAFAVGSSAALPTLKASTTPTSWPEVAASWLVFVGLALAVGGVASERFIWRRTPLNARALTAAPALPGAAPGKLTLALIISVLIAMALLPLRWMRVTAIVPLLFGVGFIAARGHSGTSGHSWAVAADMIHVSAVALWLGALAHLVVLVRNSGARATLAKGAPRYARFALPTVLLIIASGVVTAIPEFRSVGAVFTSGYGRTLLLKALLIAVALILALAARRWALPANPHPRLPLLRRLTTAEASVLAAVLVVVAVLVNAAPPRGPAAAAGQAAQLGPPPVLGPSVQLADLAGQLGLALTAGAQELRFTVVPPGDQQPGSLKLTAGATRANGRVVDLNPSTCGSTCFVARFRPTPGTTVVRAHLSSSVWRGGTVSFAIPWPLPPERPALLRRVVAAMNAIPALTLNEAVTSGPGSAGRPTGYRLSGRAFIKTEVFAGGAVDVRPIGQNGGLTEIAFALPGSNIWYRVWVDRLFRVRRELILSPGHLIRRTFSYGGAGGATPATTPSGVPLAPTLIPGSGVTPPPSGAVVLGREDGDLAIGLAVLQRGSRLELQTTILGPEGGGLSGLDVRYRVRGSSGKRSAIAGACGTGCYRASVRAAGSPRNVDVDVGGGGRTPTTVTFALPFSWPPPASDSLVAAANRTFLSLKTLVIHERLASSPTAVVTTRWELAAPDRLHYQIEGDGEAIIIGDRRWDREPGGPWQASPQAPIQQPTPTWRAWRDAHVVGSGRIAGRAVAFVSFYDPSIPAFFTIAVDTTTHRTFDLRMTAAAHFMHHRYSDFNAPLVIEPPT